MEKYYSLENITTNKKEIDNKLYEIISDNKDFVEFLNTFQKQSGIKIYFNDFNLDFIDLNIESETYVKIVFEFPELIVKDYNSNRYMKVPKFLATLYLTNVINTKKRVKEGINENTARIQLSCSVKEIPFTHALLRYIHPHIGGLVEILLLPIIPIKNLKW